MAKDLNWQEYSATTEDDDGDEHTTSVYAAVIDKDSVRREVPTRVGSHICRKGDVVIEIPGRTDIYDVLSAKEWESTGYAAESQQAPQTDTSDNETDETDPSDDDENNETDANRRVAKKSAAAPRFRRNV